MNLLSLHAQDVIEQLERSLQSRLPVGSVRSVVARETAGKRGEDGLSQLRPCPRCGKQIWLKPSKLTDGRRHYCSRYCRDQTNRRKA